MHLARRGTLRVRDRVARVRRLRQAGQHRRLGDIELAQGLAEIRLARRGETVGTLTEVDLVHVELEDLLLRQLGLDLQREQRLVDLANVVLLGRQIEVARDLHRDRRCALAARAAEVGQSRAQHALVVDAAVLVEARVFDRDHRVLHQLGDLRDRREVAPLLAVFAEQHTVGRDDAHRQLGPVVGEAADVGQARRRDREADGCERNHRHQRSHHAAEQRRCVAPRAFAPCGRIEADHRAA